MAGRRKGPYELRAVTEIDRPELRPRGTFRAVPPGTRVVFRKLVPRRSSAIAWFDNILDGAEDTPSEYVAEVQITRPLPQGGYAWVRKTVKRIRTNGGAERVSKRLERAAKQEKREHPWLTTAEAQRVAEDHARKETPTVAAPTAAAPPTGAPPTAAPPTVPSSAVAPQGPGTVAPKARLEFVDLATGEPRRAQEPGTAPTGRIVADLEGQAVEVDPEDLVGRGAPQDPRQRRYGFDLEGEFVDYRAVARQKATAKPAKPRPVRKPRIPGLRATFSSAAKAAQRFYDENEAFFDRIRDPVDGLREWAGNIDVKIGKHSSRRLLDTAAGRRIIGARMGAPQIRAALRWVFGQAMGRRWDAVPWREVDALEQALLPHFEPGGPGETSVGGIVWRPNVGPLDAATIDALPPRKRAQLRDYEARAEIGAALEQLRATYGRTARCIPGPLRRTAKHRIDEWTRWAADPSRIPGYACEPDPATGGHTCNFPTIAGELRALRRACEDAYDPDWPLAEAKVGTPGFPDVSAGEDAPRAGPPPQVMRATPRAKKPRPLAARAARDRAVGVLTGARVDRLEGHWLTFAPGRTAEPLRTQVAGWISPGKLRQLDEAGLAAVPRKLTARQHAAVERARKRDAKVRAKLQQIDRKIAEREPRLAEATTKLQIERLGGAVAAARRELARWGKIADERAREISDDAPRGASESSLLRRHFSEYGPVIDTAELARRVGLRLDAFAASVGKLRPTKRKGKRSSADVAPKPAPTKEKAKAPAAPQATATKPAPKKAPPQKAKRTRVQECASMLGKRGAEARKRRRELSEADKRRILDDALSVAIS